MERGPVDPPPLDLATPPPSPAHDAAGTVEAVGSSTGMLFKGTGDRVACNLLVGAEDTLLLSCITAVAPVPMTAAILLLLLLAPPPALFLGNIAA